MDNFTENNTYFPTDSLGRRIGLVNGFVSYNDQTLLKMKDELKLSMSLSDLKFCKDCYYESKQYNITLSELYLFDEIAKGSYSPLSNSVLTDIKFESKYLIDTYNDLFSKHNDICGGKTAPLSISSAADVISKYMKKTGRFTSRAPYLETFDNKTKNLPLETAFVMVIPNEDLSPELYQEELSSFLAEETVRDMVLKVKRINSRGIASTLSEMARGIFADIFSIPCFPTTPELSHLATEAHDMTILALPKDDIPFIKPSAEKHSLSLSYFAKVIDSNKFILAKRENISLSVETSLIRSLGSVINKAEAVVLSEKSDMMFSSEKKSLVQDGMNISLIEAEFSSPCFVGALNATLDAFLPIFISTTAAEDISVKIKYCLPEKTSPEDIGNDLSCILGVYRTLCELCVANTSTVDYNDTATLSLSCLAYAPVSRKIVGDKLLGANTAIYLLSYNIDEDGIPVFESLRDMLKFYRSLLYAGAVRSARAINGVLENEIKSMESNSKVIFEKSAADIWGKSFRGIIVEANIPLENAILLGSVFSCRQKNDN